MFVNDYFVNGVLLNKVNYPNPGNTRFFNVSDMQGKVPRNAI